MSPSGTEPDDQDLHGAGGTVSRRRASSSRVEWSFGSPTIAVRPPYGRDKRPFRHGLDGVVGALAVHIGLDRLKHVPDRLATEDHHVVHAPDGRDELRAVERRHDRAAGSLQPVHRGIVIHGHDEAVGLSGGALQVAHVPDVEDVEAAVRERHGSTRGAIGGDSGRQAGQGQDWHR